MLTMHAKNNKQLVPSEQCVQYLNVRYDTNAVLYTFLFAYN